MTVSAASSSVPPPSARTPRPPPRRPFGDSLRGALDDARRAVPDGRRPTRPPRDRAEAWLTEGPRGSPSLLPVPFQAVHPSMSAPPGMPELQAALRAAPPAIAAVSGGGAAQLSLSFGAALSVDLRAGAQGLELSLRPAPGLERTARIELPRLVEALRARGLRVTRADVQLTPAALPPASAR